MHTKNKKLEKFGITASRNRASPATTVETGTTTGKSVINLSDHTLQSDEIEILSHGLNFCPNIKMGPVGLVADTEEFIRRMWVWDFIHKPQKVSSEPHETTNEPEQLTERSMLQRPKKKELNWTPTEGRCPSLDMYAQAIRRCINIRFISRAHK
eukprot:g26121.t1